MSQSFSVGTPKAREIVEAEMAAGRRAAGVGAIYWDPIPQFKYNAPNTEWILLAQKLWSQQLLINSEPSPSEEFLDAWYELSQGIIDIVVKLFVLTQLVALANGSEKLTVRQLKDVYHTEFKPIHPMIEALKSGNPDKISKYSESQNARD